MATFPTVRIGGLRTQATATVTTAADGLSDVIDLGGLCLVSIQMSTGWTDAAITFKGSLTSSGSMGDIYDTGTELSYSTTANRMMTFPPEDLAGVRFIQLRSGATAAPVAQALPRSVILGLMPLEPFK